MPQSKRSHSSLNIHHTSQPQSAHSPVSSQSPSLQQQVAAQQASVLAAARTSENNSNSQSQVGTPTNNPPNIILPDQFNNNGGMGASGPSTGSGNVQKRRRVTRACDECRKKKVKCDGQQPCIHCTVYSYECTYDQPSNRKKNIMDNNIIENKLKLYESILTIMLPDLKLKNLSLLNSNNTPNTNSSSTPTTNNNNPNQEFNLKKFHILFNNLNTNGMINLNELVDLFNNSSSTPTPTKDDLTSYFNEKIGTPKLYRSPNILQETDDTLKEIKIILPQKEVALKLVFQTWSSACVLFRFYHRPKFIRDLDNLYETDPSHYTNHQQRLLPLIYSVMACGSLFSKKNEASVNTKNQLDDEGYRYFIAARKLIDITDVRDIYSIQTIVMLLIFLQCSARLSTCYSYIGLALRSALKEGLHRKLSHSNFNPIELETRKRLFYTIYKMDIYVNAMLGLPRSISEEDFDQELPIELDDENITEHGYLIQNQIKISSAEIANHHTKLFMILSHVVKILYPIKVNNNETLKDSTYIHNKVTELELELKNWLNQLPNELKPGGNPPLQYLTANNYLHLAFLHIQIVLYRPFIHYISPMYHNQTNLNNINLNKSKNSNSNGKTNLDPRSIQRAKNCINVARTVVRLSKTMIDNNILSGAYWFSIYTIFFSVACLVFYVHSIPNDSTSTILDIEIINIKNDAEIGKKVLTLLKDTSKAALRTFNILNALFEQLNRRTAKLHPSSGYSVQPTAAASGAASTTQPERPVPVRTNSIPIIPDVPPQHDVHEHHHPHENYVPGMIDKLDMQIFGKFLPPYMIEKNNPVPNVSPTNGNALPNYSTIDSNLMMGNDDNDTKEDGNPGVGNLNSSATNSNISNISNELPSGLSTTSRLSDDVLNIDELTDIPKYLDSLLGFSEEFNNTGESKSSN